MKIKNNKQPSFIKKVTTFIKNNSVFYPYFLYPVLSFILVIIWFHGNGFLATADQGLHLFNIVKTYTVYSHIWVQIGLGLSSPFYIPRIPYYAFLAFLSSHGATNWLILLSIYFTSITVGLIATYKLIDILIDNKMWYVPHLAAILYLFNLYVMSQVLIRFLDALLFNWAFLPLFLFFWIKWIKYSKIRYLFWLFISTFIFSSTFTLVASFFVFWIPASIFSLTCLFSSKNKKKVLLLSIIGFLFWIVTNIWWILPFFQLRNNSFAEFNNNTNNLTSLTDVSKYFPLSELLILRQMYFFGASGPWGSLYQHTKYYVLSYILFFLFSFGVIISIKSKKNYYLLFLILVAFILVKGSNPPFGGNIYYFLFTYFPITQVLRNPYEKLGVIFILPYVTFVALGIEFFIKKNKKLQLLILVIVLFCLAFLVKPMFSEYLFPSNYFIKVPDYYSKANTYVNTHLYGRIFNLPYLGDSTVMYDWNYSGEDSSELLFDRVSIAKSSHIPSTDKFYMGLGEYLSDKDFPKLLAQINVDTIIMHNDYLNQPHKQDIKMLSMNYLSNWIGITDKQSFGELDVYSLNKYKLPGLIYSPNQVIYVNSIKSGLAQVLEPNFDITSTIFIDKNYDNFDRRKILTNLESVKISFVQKSNEKYIINIKNAKKPYLLVFSMNYNSRWVLKSGQNILNTHFEVNDYANAWLINKVGTYNLILQYKTFPWD